jgi:hypothetical protein
MIEFVSARPSGEAVGVAHEHWSLSILNRTYRPLAAVRPGTLCCEADGAFLPTLPQTGHTAHYRGRLLTHAVRLVDADENLLRGARARLEPPIPRPRDARPPRSEVDRKHHTNKV